MAGLGIASLPLYAARPALDRGELIALTHIEVDNSRASEAWLLWPNGRQLLPKVRVFIDHVIALFKEGA